MSSTKTSDIKTGNECQNKTALDILRESNATLAGSEHVAKSTLITLKGQTDQIDKMNKSTKDTKDSATKSNRLLTKMLKWWRG
jgi:hypothetical protein